MMDLYAFVSWQLITIVISTHTTVSQVMNTNQTPPISFPLSFLPCLPLFSLFALPSATHSPSTSTSFCSNSLSISTVTGDPLGMAKQHGFHRARNLFRMGSYHPPNPTGTDSKGKELLSGTFEVFCFAWESHGERQPGVSTPIRNLD